MMASRRYWTPFTWLAGVLILALALSGSLPVAAQSGLGVWRVRVFSGLTESEARAKMVNMSGISDAEVLPFEGSYGIFVGKYNTEAEALEASRKLEENSGLLNRGVTFFPSATAAPANSGAGGSQFRVLISTHTDEASAQRQKQDLERQGIFPVDVIRKGDQYKVYAGYEFGSKAEADSYIASTLKDLNITPQGIENPNAAVAPPRVDTNVLSNYEQWIKDAMASGDTTRAEQLLNEWEKAEPNNSKIQELRDKLADLTKPTPEPRVDPRAAERERYESMKAQATSAENSGNFDEAIRLWQEISKLPNIMPEESLEARQTIVRLNEKRFAPTGETAPAAETENKGGLNPMVIIGGIIGLVAIVGGGLFFFLRSKKKSQPAPPERTGSKPAVSTMSTGGGMMMPSAQTPPAPVAQSAVSPATPVTRKSTSAAPKPAPAASPVPPTPLPATPAPVAASAAEETQLDQDALNLDEMFGEEEDQPASPAAESAKAAPKEQAKPATERPSTDRRPIPIVRDAANAGAEKKKPPQRPAPVGSSDETEIDASSRMGTLAQLSQPRSGRVTFFEQSFDDEEVGKAPKSWQGEYEYASLSVAARDDGDGSGKCLRFEKLSGTGSAYYSCKFPDASGRVVVEFDLRCDHKNKYLLGFYVEKDGDFRHSVHTVVHRDIANSEKITLRLQNESIAYKLKEWVHVRLSIDLPRSLVDAHVNNESVAVGVRLASKPKVLNTLSIRDNLATEGILMIDNIKIYQDR